VSPVLRPELRFRKLWFFIGLMLVALITVLSLLPSHDLPDVHVSDKVEHTLAYVALGFWFGCLVARRDLIWLGLALVAFGGLIELLQGWMALGRQADIRDLWADVLGVAIGFVLVLSPLGRIARWLEYHLSRVRA
jgi:VanZ family protein